MSDLFQPANSFESKKAKIKVIGVGGGGGNAINHMVDSGLKDVDFIAVNTDAQDLRRNKAPYLVQVGEKITKGLGVGGEPERGRLAAEESAEKLKLIIGQCDLLFITAGMGGGTGTGVAPYLAKLAKETYGDDLLVVGVVTRPFNFEGYVREKHADEGIKEMQKYVDSMIIVPNEKLFSIIDPKTSSREAFQMVDEVLLQAVKGISEVITQPGEVNIDFNDDIHGAKGFIVHFLAADLTMIEVGEAMNLIRQYASNDSLIMYGHSFDASLGDRFQVTVIATGFSAEKANLYTTRRTIASLERSGMGSTGVRNTMPQPVLEGLDAPKATPQDEMLIPAFMRRKKGRL